MTISIYSISVETFVPMLTNLSNLLDKGAEHARANGKSPDDLLSAKLAPDMFPLSRQVQIACRHAREPAYLLAGLQPPEGQFTEMSFDELKEFLAGTIALVKGLDPAKFEGAEDRQVEMTLRGPRYLAANGLQLLRDFAMPNFYFHVVTAYDILRNQGVEVGKTDFMGPALVPLIKTRG